MRGYSIAPGGGAHGAYSSADARVLAHQEQERQARLDRGFADGSPFKDQIIGRIRYFEDGSVNYYGFPVSVRYRLDELRARPRAKRGESESPEESRHASAKRAKKNVRLRCQSISADRLLTLTYRDNMVDPERLKRDFDAFRRAMKGLGAFPYVAVPERQKRGAWHVHVAVHGRLVYNLVRAIWWRIVGKGQGNIDVRNPRTGGKWKRHALAAYIAKYIAKDHDSGEFNKKRYWTSAGIVVPEPQTYLVGAVADLHQIISDACMAALDVSRDLQAYTSDGGRYFFVAASPG